MQQIKAEYEIPWKWVPLQILGLGISIWIMGTGAALQPDRCPPSGPCDPYLAFLLQAIGFVLFCVLGYSLMKMSFGKAS
jgi:hypothetical protein